MPANSDAARRHSDLASWNQNGASAMPFSAPTAGVAVMVVAEARLQRNP
ncbi:hypothetical protein LMG31886_41400 [Xanthomonas hydrangeae]|nr:hypothetical protein LMG31885_18990 [Xanthomonas hydrangeae]CAD7733048.1 hypothetical protein LMG31885_18990 [Xanthomonas hydrangeae]CAD7746675.1 hypothetical protein LMG31886_41400 [Xanthomonas hydrangeae]CAD7746677.1 hypothetical protein LMG31886_41400 [Xanthomonas hydrangeae]